jgi:hypothetical protein
VSIFSLHYQYFSLIFPIVSQIAIYSNDISIGLCFSVLSVLLSAVILLMPNSMIKSFQANSRFPVYKYGSRILYIFDPAVEICTGLVVIILALLI